MELDIVTKYHEIVFKRLVYSVWGIIFFYSCFFSWLQAWSAAAVVAFGVFFIIPLVLYLYHHNYQTISKLFFIISSNCYVYFTGLILKHETATEYYYYCGLLLPFLIFEHKYKKSIFIGILTPFSLWIAATSFGYNFLPEHFFPLAPLPVELIKVTNFAGAFILCLIYIKVIVKTISTLTDQVLIAQKEALQVSKLVSIGEMAAGIGHEINNPLAISLGHLQKCKKILRNEIFTPADLISSLKKQEDALNRITAIVDSLRKYTQMDYDKSTDLNTPELIHKTQLLTGDIFEKEGICFEVKLNAKQFYVKGNYGSFQQILMILLINAKDATLEVAKPSISLTSENMENELVLKVSDNGMGIPEENRDKIFESFFTTKKLGKGTGMGLGMLSKMVHDMKGRVTLDSEVGKGTTFSLYFPTTLPPSTTTIAISSEERLATQERSPLAGKALIVDDEEGIREVLSEYLRDFGLEVDEADDGTTALEKVKHNSYDYIITDMKMPNISGDKFILEAKKINNSKSFYFIITGGIPTNFSKKSDIDLKDLIDGFITKPFTEETIYSALSQVDNKEWTA